MKSRKVKYYVELTSDYGLRMIESDSRNARKHLIENDASIVRVFKTKGHERPELVSSACRLMDCILVGTPPKK